MSALNPIYGFIGRSSNTTAMTVVPSYTGLSQVVQAAIALGNDDPTRGHVAAYAQSLSRKFAGMPTDAQWAWGFSEESLYARSDNGVAFIPVWGMLFNKCGWACSYFTGYDYIRDAFSAALADENVTAIVFDVDSFGGEVQGCMELADWMFAQRDLKPTMAIANSNACSAAFAILSSASRSTAIESSYIGSVGVVLMHVDYSGYLEKKGLKVTVLHEGEHKVDGMPYKPLPDSVKKEWQADLAKTRERFANLVARNRGMTVDAVMATEARVYTGEDAVGIGFIDAVLSPVEAITAFTTTELSGSSTQENEDMTTQQKPGAQATPESTATPAVTTPAAAAPSAGAERARIKAITSSDEAKGREALAEHLAFETSMTADEAKAILAAAPKSAAAVATNPFETAMAATGNPNVGAGAETGEAAESKPQNQVAALLRDYGSATGQQFK